MFVCGYIAVVCIQARDYVLAYTYVCMHVVLRGCVCIDVCVLVDVCMVVGMRVDVCGVTQ